MAHPYKGQEMETPLYAATCPCVLYNMQIILNCVAVVAIVRIGGMEVQAGAVREV